MIDKGVRGRVPLFWRYMILAALLLPAVVLQATVGLGIGNPKVVVAEETLPATVGNWVGKSTPLTEDELSLLQSPASSQKVYTNTHTDERIQLLLLQVNNTQNAHDPKICMRGSGFDLVSEEEVDAPWVGLSGKPHRVTKAVFGKSGLRITMFYWIQTPTGTIADMSAGLKLTGVLRAIQGQATRGVAVRIVCLPYGEYSPTPAETGIEFWKELNQVLDIEKLVAGM